MTLFIFFLVMSTIVLLINRHRKKAIDDAWEMEKLNKWLWLQDLHEKRRIELLEMKFEHDMIRLEYFHKHLSK